MNVSKPIIRPATQADIETFSDLRSKPSVKAWVAELDGEIIGLGGAAFVGGRWFAFLDITDKMRPFKMTLMRTAILFLRELHKQGVKFIYAEADLEESNAPRWLGSLGFTIDPRSGYLYRWRG